MRYPNSFDNQKAFYSELNTDEFRSLRSRQVSEYFSDDSTELHGSEGLTSALTLNKDEVARFEADFVSLLNHRKHFHGLSRARSFSLWWDEHKTAYLTRPVARSYRDSGITLGEFLDDLHLHFVAGQLAHQNSSKTVRVFRTFFRNKVFLTASFSVAMLLAKSVGFLWSLAVLGPGVQMVNSYTQTVVTPLAQTAQQKGSKDLGPFAANIQNWLTNRQHANLVRKELHQTTEKLEKTDFTKLTPEQAQAKWAQFEQTYFKLFLNYNQTLPSHLRDGRGLLKEWMMFAELGVANNLSTFDTQYWTHARELETLNAQMRAHEGHVTAKELKLVRLHRDEMTAAESRIAGALAAWKLYEFMYPEFSREPGNWKNRNELKGIYQAFLKSMRFDTYVKQFAVQMQDILKQMDADFLNHDELAQASVPRHKL